MYIPTAFKVDELEVLHNLMQAYNFATLVTCQAGTPFATHLPFMLHPQQGQYGTLVAHMARANPQWHYFNTDTEVLVIFQGPHTYISPSWYTSEFSVPTWNYAAVHAYGIPRLIEDPAALQQALDELVQHHEEPRTPPWTFEWSERHVNLTKAIVAFEITITRLEGKLKLSQNRSAEDRLGVIHGLSHSPAKSDRAVAALMVAPAQAKATD